MSIYTDMVLTTLQCNNPSKGLSGALISEYVDVDDIHVAIYKNDAFKSNQSVKYEESTHNGITFYKGFVEGKEYRLMIGTTPMEVKSFNTSGRFTTLLLKQVVLK